MRRVTLRRGSHILLAVAVAIISAPESTLPQIVGGSIVRREALDSIPQHLTEIGWDTDVPSLFVIRFQPEKMNFQPSWSDWATELSLKQSGFMARAKVDPWPPIFISNVSAATLSPEDMQLFQAWCLRRSQVIPPIIVHAVPYVAPIAREETVTVRPFGLQAKQPKSSQVAIAVGFVEMVGLILSRDADDFSATVPPEVVASLPVAGVSLETRLRWSNPYPNNDPMVANAALLIPAEPVSLRLVDSHRRVLWERRFGADAEKPAPGSAPGQAQTKPPAPTPDIKF
jgi:hypothetical protein